MCNRPVDDQAGRKRTGNTPGTCTERATSVDYLIPTSRGGDSNPEPASACRQRCWYSAAFIVGSETKF
jgi:hypothetical protein